MHASLSWEIEGMWDCRLLILPPSITFAMKLECILFSPEEVLYSLENYQEKALLKTAKSMLGYGLKISKRELLDKLHSLPTMSNANLITLCESLSSETGKNSKDLNPFMAGAAITAYNKVVVSQRKRIESSRRVLEKLSCYDLAMVINGNSVEQSMTIIDLKLDEYFDKPDKQSRLFATEKARQCKPRPYLWNMAQVSLGFVYERSVMVCSSWEDVFGAKKLGLITIHVTQEESPVWHDAAVAAAVADSYVMQCDLGHKEVKDLLSPDYTIESIADLPKKIGILERQHDFDKLVPKKKKKKGGKAKK